MIGPEGASAAEREPTECPASGNEARMCERPGAPERDPCDDRVPAEGGWAEQRSERSEERSERSREGAPGCSRMQSKGARMARGPGHRKARTCAPDCA